jgi:hypothetical protein
LTLTFLRRFLIIFYFIFQNEQSAESPSGQAAKRQKIQRPSDEPSSADHLKSAGMTSEQTSSEMAEKRSAAICSVFSAPLTYSTGEKNCQLNLFKTFPSLLFF